MSAPLTYPMKLALRDIATRPRDGWQPDWDFHKSQLNALERRGLVERLRRWDAVRLTDAGREAAANLEGASNV